MHVWKDVEGMMSWASSTEVEFDARCVALLHHTRRVMAEITADGSSLREARIIW